jgi:hypothetical protein
MAKIPYKGKMPFDVLELVALLSTIKCEPV